ncbi:MAG: D-alanyl-D-alanine carboxypeptidase family protein [Gammaproteobacteria bacterium]
MKALRLRLIALVAITLLPPAQLWAQAPVPAAPSLGAKGYLLIDFNSGSVLANRAENERLEPASITKLMTAYAVFAAIRAGQIALDDEVLISEKAWRTTGSRMFIEVGKRVSVELLLQGMIIQSGNDASVALAEHVAGSEEVFAQVMNQTAAQLGMTSSNYQNSTGLPGPEHYTTAADIAKLATAIIREFPQFYSWYSQKEFTYNGITQENRNALLWRDPYVDGMKTGFTEAAGYCLVSSAERDGMRLVAIVLGTESTAARASESQSLLNYGFRFFESRLAYEAGNKVTDARVWMGTQEQVELGVSDDIYVTIPRGSAEQLETSFDLPVEITAPLETGTQTGRVRLSIGGNTLAEAALFPLAAVPEGSLWQQGIDSVLLMFE